MKAVPEVLGDEILMFFGSENAVSFGGKFSSKKESPPGRRNIGPWSAMDPMGTEPPQPFLAT